MENNKLRLLMLEDSADDASLILKTLQRAAFVFESCVVHSRSDLIKALDEFKPDLILSDHQLPQFTSPEALRICKAALPSIPFILVTGAVSEEFAASIIREGADDYLLKGNLKRLPTAILHAIEKRRMLESLQKSNEANMIAERDLKKAHERLLFHIENTTMGFIEWDNQLNVKSWSKRAEEIFGWTEQEFIENQKHGLNNVYDQDLESYHIVADQLISGSVDRNNVQYRNYTKDGRVIWCDWFNSVMKDEEGKVVAIMSLVQDITGRKTFEDVLQEYNNRYQILSKATNDAIWDWDIEQDFELWNHGIQTIFGYTERQINSTEIWRKEKIHPADHERVNQEINEAFSSKSTNWNSEYQYLCADGTYKHVLDRGYIIYNGNKPVRMIGAIQDITEKKMAIEEIKKLSLVASKTNNSVIITDEEDRIEWVNTGFVSLTGYTLAEVKGQNPGKILQGPETDKATVQRITTRLQNYESFTEEIINYSRSGRKYWLRLDISPVFDEKQKLRHFIAIQTDISPQKEFENQITNIARELSSLIENANVPIFGVDRNGYINEWNKISTELSEYGKNEVLGKKWTSFFDPSIHVPMQEILGNVFVGESKRNYELPFQSKNGKQLILLISISPRMDVNKNIYGAICVGQDITELFRYRQGLERMVDERTRDLNVALQKEKELVDLKSKFVSIASHEFRTPLSTISLIAGLLQKHRQKITDEEYNNKLETIEKQVQHMTYLLDDILTIGKADAGKIQTNYSIVSIRPFFTQLSKEIEASIGTHKIIVVLNCSVNEFHVDEKLLRNILINLLTNAAKFSILIKTVELYLSNSNDFLILEVRDKGIGIREEDMKSLFTPFFRGKNVGTVQGTGLGLSIVKKAVDLLKGEIKIISRPGKGTTITVLLPLKV